jgi:hypothetical protein
MSSSYSYSDDEDIDIRVARGGGRPVYVDSRQRPRSYYATGGGPPYLVPEQRTVITTRERSRSRDRRSSPPSAPPPAPVIINNRIYNDMSSDEDVAGHGRLQLARPRRSHSRSRPSSQLMTKEEYELERAKRELDSLRLDQASKEKQSRTEKELREEAELRRAKRELEEIRAREDRQKEEARIKRELELQRLKEQEREEAEKKRREKEAQEAVDRYRKKEMERQKKEEEEKKAQEKEYQRRLQEDLIKSGLDEKQIAAIMKKEKVPEAREERADGPRPTYTRMARRHLSIETLRTFHIEYDLDNVRSLKPSKIPFVSTAEADELTGWAPQDPEFILIKRWVPEWEQDTLWKHTKYVREKRSKLLVTIDDRKPRHHHHREPEFEWVRKKSDRRRSKSPSLLMYLAGAKPA